VVISRLPQGTFQTSPLTCLRSASHSDKKPPNSGLPLSLNLLTHRQFYSFKGFDRFWVAFIVENLSNGFQMGEEELVLGQESC
jgi:hypothetical protein